MSEQSAVAMDEVSCESCVGACCRGRTRINLSPDEAQRMINAGTELRPIIPFEHLLFRNPLNGEELLGIDEKPFDPENATTERIIELHIAFMESIKDDPELASLREAALEQIAFIQQGEALYLMDSDCGFLDPDTFACSTYETRPYACRAFPVGEEVCVQARERFGVATAGEVAVEIQPHDS